ncbi:MAG: PTS sugar transporter subunit IIA [Elusimicrobia bacterium]|nr:PTS sugar transporter subunit IIA [Elusimicrobiota bacterium]
MKPSPAALCPGCGLPLDKARLSDSVSTYGCSRCGKWFPREDAGVPGPAPGFKALAKTPIVIGLACASLADAAQILVPKALHGSGKVAAKSADIAEEVREGIKLSSLELREGLAFIHHRVAGISERRLALGISHDGIPTGSSIQERVYIVFLSLMPENRPGYEVPLWSRRKLCNQQTIYRLRKAPDVDTVLSILKGL